MRCSTSGRLTPAAATLIRISWGFGSGRGRSASRRTSAPPGWLISMTFIYAMIRAGGRDDEKSIAGFRHAGGVPRAGGFQRQEAGDRDGDRRDPERLPAHHGRGPERGGARRLSGLGGFGQ